MEESVTTVLTNAEQLLRCLPSVNKALQRKTIIATIRDLLNYVEQDRDGYLCYLMGCCFYILPFDDPLRESEWKWFHHALEKSPGNHYARLYLANLFFDYTEFNKALSLALDIPDGYFTSQNNPWQDLQVKVLILCCEQHLTPKLVNVPVFLAFRKEFMRLSKKEKTLPEEIRQSILWTVANTLSPHHLTTVFKWLITWIQHMKTDFLSQNKQTYTINNACAYYSTGKPSH